MLANANALADLAMPDLDSVVLTAGATPVQAVEPSLAPRPKSKTKAEGKSQAPLQAKPSAASDIEAEAEAELSPGFAQLGLARPLLAAVADLGFTTPTPVQAQTIPAALRLDESGGDDLMVSSQTGSGKTAAFLLPMLHHLWLSRERVEQERAAAAANAANTGAPRAKRVNPRDPRNFKPAVPQALVLCPTRELAQQVASDAIDLVRHCRGVRVASVVGGMPYGEQIARLQNADLVVATPGRLLDLQQGGQLHLNQVQFLVVDEADRMLDLGFAEDLEAINNLCASRAQTMMFSATFAPRIMQLGARLLRQGAGRVQRLQLDSPQQGHAHIRQVLHWADDAQHKRRLLDHGLRDASLDQAIVFTSTQVECDQLAEQLQQQGFSAVALHGAMNQGQRNRRLGALRRGDTQVLVATDVAARGIDVPTITHVFNYGLPMKAEDYTHRIGRTGRAGRQGLAITLAEPRERRRLAAIEAFTRQPFQAQVVPGLEPRLNHKPAHAEFARPGRGAKAGGPRSFGKPARGASSAGGFGAPAYGRRDDNRGDSRDGDYRGGNSGGNSGRAARGKGARGDGAVQVVWQDRPATRGARPATRSAGQATRPPARSPARSGGAHAHTKPAPRRGATRA